MINHDLHSQISPDCWLLTQIHVRIIELHSCLFEPTRLIAAHTATNNIGEIDNNEMLHLLHSSTHYVDVSKVRLGRFGENNPEHRMRAGLSPVLAGGFGRSICTCM